MNGYRHEANKKSPPSASTDLAGEPSRVATEGEKKTPGRFAANPGHLIVSKPIRQRLLIEFYYRYGEKSKPASMTLLRDQPRSLGRSSDACSVVLADPMARAAQCFIYQVGVSCRSRLSLAGSIDAYLFIPCPARLGRPVCSVRRFGFCRSAPNVGYQLMARLAMKRKSRQPFLEGGFVYLARI